MGWGGEEGREEGDDRGEERRKECHDGSEEGDKVGAEVIEGTRSGRAELGSLGGNLQRVGEREDWHVGLIRCVFC